MSLGIAGRALVIPEAFLVARKTDSCLEGSGTFEPPRKRPAHRWRRDVAVAPP